MTARRPRVGAPKHHGAAAHHAAHGHAKGHAKAAHKGNHASRVRRHP